MNGYYIEYELLNEDNCKPIEDPVRVSYSFVNDTRATINGLLPFSVYNIYVTATNEAGNATAAKLDAVETDQTGIKKNISEDAEMKLPL